MREKTSATWFTSTKETYVRSTVTCRQSMLLENNYMLGNMLLPKLVLTRISNSAAVVRKVVRGISSCATTVTHVVLASRLISHLITCSLHNCDVPRVR